MYNSEGLSKCAQEFLKAEASEETLNEVRDVSTATSCRDIGFRELREMALRAERAVLLWRSDRCRDLCAHSTSGHAPAGDRDRTDSVRGERWGGVAPGVCGSAPRRCGPHPGSSPCPELWGPDRPGGGWRRFSISWRSVQQAKTMAVAKL